MTSPATLSASPSSDETVRSTGLDREAVARALWDRQRDRCRGPRSGRRLMPEWGSSKQLPEERALYLSDADSILSLTNTDPADPASREAVADDGFVRVPRDLLKPFVAVAKHIGTKDGVAIGWNHDHICLQDIVRLAAAAPPALALSDELGGEG